MIPVADLPALIQQCAPQVAACTVQSFIQVESSYKPFTLNVNGSQVLARPPRNMSEAISWAQWLIEHGYSVDMGYCQINSQHIRNPRSPAYRMTAEQILDPCTNLRICNHIIASDYQRALKIYKDPQKALHAAASAFNTGNYRKGFSNGYVQRVYNAAKSLCGVQS